MIVSFPELTDLPTTASQYDLFYLTSLGNSDLTGYFNAGTIYLATDITTGIGTISFTGGSNTITGNSTTWNTAGFQQLSAGTVISIDSGVNKGNWVVASVSDDTTAILVGDTSDKLAQIRAYATASLSGNGIVLQSYEIGDSGNYIYIELVSQLRSDTVNQGDIPASTKNTISISKSGSGTSTDYYVLTVTAKKNEMYDLRKTAGGREDFYKCNIEEVNLSGTNYTKFIFQKSDNSTYPSSESFLTALDIRGDDSGGSGGHSVKIEFPSGYSSGALSETHQVYQVINDGSESALIINDSGSTYFDSYGGLANQDIVFTFWKDNNPESVLNATPPYTVAPDILEQHIATAITNSDDALNTVFTKGNTATSISSSISNTSTDITVTLATDIETFNKTGSIVFDDSVGTQQVLRYQYWDKTSKMFKGVQVGDWVGSGNIPASTVIKQYSSDITFTADDITNIAIVQSNIRPTNAVTLVSKMLFTGGESGASYILPTWTATSGYDTSVENAAMPSDALLKTKYIGKDFHTHRAEALSFMKKRFPSKFNDFAASDSAIMLIESMSYMMDTLSFYLDLQANETFFSTANLDSSITKLARYLGYKPHGASSASTSLDLSGITPTSHDITIPQNSKWTADNGIIYENDVESIISAGNTTHIISVSQGSSETITFVSNGNADQKFYIERVASESYIMSGTTLLVDGVTWAEVDNISLDSEAKEYEVMYTESPPYVKFGDGLIGEIPAVNGVISLTYRVGLGTKGMVAANTIVSGPTLTNTNANSIAYSVTNLTTSTGGNDGETISSVKVNAPKVFNTAYRAVSQDDWDALAGAYSHETHGSLSKARSVVMTSIQAGGTIDILFRDLTALVQTTMEMIAEQAGFVSADINMGITSSAGSGHLQLERYEATGYGESTNLETFRPYSISTDYGINDINQVIDIPEADIVIYGTKQYGILLFNRSGDLIGSLNKDNTSMKSNNITAMYRPDDDIWSHHWHGMSRVNGASIDADYLSSAKEQFMANRIFFGVEGGAQSGNGGMYSFSYIQSSVDSFSFEDYTQQFISRWQLDTSLGSEPNIKVNCIRLIPGEAMTSTGEVNIENCIFWGTDGQGVWVQNIDTGESSVYCAESMSWNTYDSDEASDYYVAGVSESVVSALGVNSAKFLGVTNHVSGEFIINRILDIQFKYMGDKAAAPQGGQSGYPRQGGPGDTNYGYGSWNGIYILSHAGMIVCPYKHRRSHDLKTFYASPFIHGASTGEGGTAFNDNFLPIGQHRYYGKSMNIFVDGSIFVNTGNEMTFAHPCCADNIRWPLNMASGEAGAPTTMTGDGYETVSNWKGGAPFTLVDGGLDRFGIPFALKFDSTATPNWNGYDVKHNIGFDEEVTHWSGMTSPPSIDNHTENKPSSSVRYSNNGDGRLNWDIPRMVSRSTNVANSGMASSFNLQDVYLQATPYGAMGLSVNSHANWQMHELLNHGLATLGGVGGFGGNSGMTDSFASAWLQYLFSAGFKWAHQYPYTVYSQQNTSNWMVGGETIDLVNNIYGTPSVYQGGLTFNSTYEIEQMSDIDNKISQIKDVFSGMITAGDTKAHVIVYALSVDRNGYYIDPSSSLMNSLWEYLDERKIITVTHEVVGGSQYLIKLRLSIKIKVNSAYREATVSESVKISVESMLKGRDFGKNLYVSQVYEIVNSVTGVEYSYISISSVDSADKINTNYDVIIKDYEIITKDTSVGAIAVGAISGNDTTAPISNDSNTSIILGGS